MAAIYHFDQSSHTSVHPGSIVSTTILVVPQPSMSTIIRLNASEHPVRSVTVFKSSKAEVVRLFNLSLEKGSNKVEIRRLSGSINTDSARVAGLGDAQLLDVVCALDSEKDDVSPESTSEVIRVLSVKQHKLVKRREALTAVQSVMEKYSQTLNGQHVTPEQADGYLLKYMERSEAIAAAHFDVDEEMLQLTRQVDKLVASNTANKGEATGKVTVTIVTQQATEVELRLTYLVNNATWNPTYELHSVTDGGLPTSTVSLHYRANITQSTGEDWTDVALTLSTAETGLANQRIPELSPTRIRPPRFPTFGQPAQAPSAFGASFGSAPPRQAAAPAALGFGRGGLFGNARQTTAFGQSVSAMSTTGQPAASAPTANFGAFESSSVGQPPQIALVQDQHHDPPAPTTHPDWEVVAGDADPTPFAETPAAVIKETPLAVSYVVEGEASIPSDGVAHQVSVARLSFESSVVHVTVPKAKPILYLQANVKNTSDFRLLPGPVNVFVDDSYVSQTAIQTDVTPGDAFECTLGSDSTTRIRYTRIAKVTTAPASSFSEQFSTTTYTSRATIENRHAFGLKTLIVRDALPISDDERRVSVVLRRPAPLADMKDEDEQEFDSGEGEVHTVRWSRVKGGKGGKKEGMFEWVCTLEAGKEVTLETVWDVKAPANVRWVEN